MDAIKFIQEKEHEVENLFKDWHIEKLADEMENFAKEYHAEQLRLHIVSKSLPTKKYEIDFGGNVLAGLEITNNELVVIGAMNGWGNGISKDEINITEK